MAWSCATTTARHRPLPKSVSCTSQLELPPRCPTKYSTAARILVVIGRELPEFRRLKGSYIERAQVSGKTFVLFSNMDCITASLCGVPPMADGKENIVSIEQFVHRLDCLGDDNLHVLDDPKLVVL